MVYQAIKTIFFDAAGTLFSVRGSVGQVYSEEARRFGITGSGGTDWLEIEKRFVRVFAAREPMLFPDASSEELPELERHWWRGLVQETFGNLADTPRFAEFFDSLYELFGTARPWQLEPGCGCVLAELKQRGFELAVISNFDSRLPAILSALRIHDMFDHVFVSSLLKSAKPSPEIFRIALKTTGRESGECVHVGDNPRDDVRGAASVGMRGILYDPGGHGIDTHPLRIDRLEELLGLLPESAR